MFAGKSTEMLRRVRKHEITGKKILTVKFSADNRYDVENGSICTHEGQTRKATEVVSLASLGDSWKDFDCIGIDEGQFFDNEIVRVCNDLANKGIRVIVAGLDMDFKGNPFGPMPNLMATAEYVTKVHAVCTKTGNLAQYSYRKAKSNNLVLLGEVEEYEPLSRAAYYKSMLREKLRNITVNEHEELSTKRKTGNG